CELNGSRYVQNKCSECGDGRKIFALNNMPKLHELTGQITAKELRKVYDKKSLYRGNIIYKLTVLLDNKKGGDFIFVYPNLVGAEILRTIEQSHYIDKRYLFWCEKKPKR
ncbi:15105_t:CDS:2, partial [Gigaspora margarita]